MRFVIGRERIPLSFRGPKQAELKLEPVAVERRLSHDLRQAAFALTAHEVHLEEPELRMDVTGGEEEVVVGLRSEVRGAVLLEQDFHRLLQTGKDRKSTRLNSSHRCISYAV